MSFAHAVLKSQNGSRTENGMQTFASSLNPLVDLFFTAGASRGKDITTLFEQAYQENRISALRLLAWLRDVRGGAGERQTFRKLINYIEENHPSDLEQLLNVTPYFGRWDDLLVTKSDKGRTIAFSMIKDALSKCDGLCAKWMPRKGPLASALRKYLEMTPKQYRKTLVAMTNVVETKMCAKLWTEIDYSHVPSVAASRYQKAFNKRDPQGYQKYKESLIKGEAKVNAQAIFPHDIIKSLRHGGDNLVVAAQWDALPNYIGDQLILPMVDVSGSMSCPVLGSTNLSCIDVAVGLGLYLADKNTGPFKDMFLTFSGKSKIEMLKGNIVAKFKQLSRANWELNTNLHSAFDEILKVGTINKLSDTDMPKYVIILSDMEFDNCIRHDDNAMDMIKRKYEAASYTVPQVIFWNLNARGKNVPVSSKEDGTALVSGFSPSIMKGILSAKLVTPLSIMYETINNARYNVFE